MNKKFFAALASATMAFTASGSIAVFADDFVEENTPTVKPDEIKPTETKVKWDKEHFGELAYGQNAVTFEFDGDKIGLDDLVGKEVSTADLARITKIKLNQYWSGEIKGLEYFTGLLEFNDENGANITNKTLDFSANTKLVTLKVSKAADLTGIELPNAYKNTDDEDVFALKTVILQNTKMTALDLSSYNQLDIIYANNNFNLSEVKLPKGKSSEPKPIATLNLANNALKTVNLDHTTINDLHLGGNHIGALDLSKTTVTNSTLDSQTFYVSEDAVNVKLTEAFPELKVWNVSATSGAKFDKDTAGFTFDKDANAATYTYTVALKGATKNMTVQITKANPMNRLYNPNSGEHFYTADLKEKEALVKLGWNDEGTGWYSADAAGATKPGEGHVTVYRQYNPFANGTGSHNYTTDKAENDYLVSLGWTYEGAAWTALR